MRRAPRRSVRAPTGMRPRDPTMTGTATSNACWNAVAPSCSRRVAPSGDSRAHAQNVTANPTVATASIRAGLPVAPGSVVPGVVLGAAAPRPGRWSVLAAAVLRLARDSRLITALPSVYSVFLPRVAGLVRRPAGGAQPRL